MCEPRPHTGRTARLLLVALILLATIGPSPVHASDLKDFSSDGCSLFPEGTVGDRLLWCECCFAHDIAYWQGGTEQERRRADAALRDCVLDRTKDRALAEMMHAAVRSGGHPVFPMYYRWAYGWSYGRGYAPLSEGDRQLVRKGLERYRREHPEGYCSERTQEREKERGRQ